MGKLMEMMVGGDIEPTIAKADEMLEGLEVGGNVTDLINQRIDAMIEQHPDRAKELYLQKHELIQEVAGDEIDILKASVAQEMTVKEKVGFLLHMWFGDVFWGQLSRDMVQSGDIKAAQKTLAEKAKELDGSKFVIADGTNLIFPSNAGMFGQARKLFGMVTPFLGKDAEGNDRFELLTGATVVLPRIEEGKNALGGKAALNFEAIGRTLTPPVEVEVVSAMESKAGTKVPDNVLRIMYAPREGLPFRDGQVDMKALEGFAKVYESGDTMWFSPEIVAAILVFKGLSPAQALASVKIKKGVENYDNLLADLGRLEVQLNGGSGSVVPADDPEAGPVDAGAVADADAASTAASTAEGGDEGDSSDESDSSAS